MHLRHVLAALGAAAFASSARASETVLFPPPLAPDVDAYGKLEVVSSATHQEFRVRAYKLAMTSPPGPFQVWLETGMGSGTCAFLGVMTPKGGAWELKLDGDGAPPVALAVPDLADLAGRHLQVRDAGGESVYLYGFVPSPNPGGCAKSGPALHGKRDLQRPAPAVDADAFGAVDIEKKSGKQSFAVDAKKLDPTTPHSVYVETGVRADVYVFVCGLVLKTPAIGRFAIDLEAECMAPMVAGVLDLASLTDRRIQVRDAADHVVLETVIPELLRGGGAKGNFVANVKMAPPPGSPSPKATGWIRAKLVATQGTSTLEIFGAKMSPTPVCCAFVEDDVGVGTFSFLGDLVLNKAKTSGRVRLDTKKGDPLPFGVPTVAELSGRKIRLQDENDVVHLEGTIP
ncbi:MAG TPA: hypothetical protein VKE69_04485 [Planctomycetota bacterium]|nr:hypothetical protein [Planctomycetota bacterium]